MKNKIKIGDTIYSPCQDYPFDQNDSIITEVVEIDEKNNTITDSDGDVLKMNWLGKNNGFFLSEQEMIQHHAEDLWLSACNGDIKQLKKYYEHPLIHSHHFSKFGHKVSLVMGAFNNQQYDTVDFLLQQGETLTEEEHATVALELRKLQIMKKMTDK